MISSMRSSVTFPSSLSWSETWKIACRISVRSTAYPIRQRTCSGLLRVQHICWDNKGDKPTVFGRHHLTARSLGPPPPSLCCFVLKSTSAVPCLDIPIWPTLYRRSLHFDDWDHPRRLSFGDRMRHLENTIKSESRDTFHVHSCPYLIQTPDIPDLDNVFMYRI